MRTILLIFLLFYSCTPEVIQSPEDCLFCDLIPTVANDLAFDADGMIMQQNAGPRRDHIVEAASILWLEGDVYSLEYLFTTGDRLEVILTKVTQDFNHHFPKPESENQILEVYWNDQLMELKDAALSIQPRADEGSFHTVANIHTLYDGDWNGTVNGVVVVE